MFPDIIPIDGWSLFPKEKRPLVISGPCSAENEQMVIETARQLCSMGISVFRAGIWKPRTHPNTFEGVGEAGFPWLQRVKSEVGMKVATEVASAAHVETALRYGIDLLWVGARSTANPFAVQEISDALRGIDVPVLVKNPISPDIELWMGAIERFYNAGIRRLGIVHRGFSSYEKIRYKNNPLWQMAIEMRRRLPDIPFFCDPSHIAGDKQYVEEISRTAINLGFQGLMIESHIDPVHALSDADQQLTPTELRTLLDSLQIKKEAPDDSTIKALIEDLRSSIDKIDESLLDLLQTRMELVDQIGQAKLKGNISVLQISRWDSLLKEVTRQAESRGLNPIFIRQLFQIIHQASLQRQLVGHPRSQSDPL